MYLKQKRKSKIYLTAGKLRLIMFFNTLYNIYLMHFLFYFFFYEIYL